MEEKELRDLEIELKILRKTLDYRNVKLCKKQLDKVLKEYFGDI